MTQVGDTKLQEAAIQGLHPLPCHPVTYVSLGVVGQQIDSAVGTEAGLPTGESLEH